MALTMLFSLYGKQGKTVMLMALILKSKEERRAKKVVGGPTATLVVAKLSLLPQWEDEIKSKSNLTYRIYYGQNGKHPGVHDLQGVVSWFIFALAFTIAATVFSNFSE